MDLKRRSGKRRLAVYALALSLSLAFAGLAAASASADQRWYTCGASESGPYTDSGCQTQGSGGYGWTEASSSPTPVGVYGTAEFTLSGLVSLASSSFACSSAEAVGSISDPEEGNGEFSTESELSLVLYGCEMVSKDPTCGVGPDGIIEFGALQGEATTFEGSPALKIQPAEGSTFASFVLEHCTKKAYRNAKVTIGGALYALVNPATSSLEFTEATSGSTLLNDEKAVFTGTAELKTEAGGVRLGTPAPVSTGLPAISGLETVGSTLTASSGSWANSPTAYTYRWKRCNTWGGECTTTVGFSKEYVPGSADENHRLRVEVTATNAGGSTSASSSATAIIGPEPGGPYHWYACQEVAEGTGNYEDAACSTGAETIEGAIYEWEPIEEGSPVGFTSSNSTPITFSFENGAYFWIIKCSSESGSGTVLNPSGGGSGTLTGGSDLLALSGCEFTNSTKCTVAGGEITSTAITGESDQSDLALTSSSGGLLQMSFDTCTSFSELTATGTLHGAFNNLSSSLDFDYASSSELQLGMKSWFEGSIELRTEEGGLLRLKP
jgi:hypothetical protein